MSDPQLPPRPDLDGVPSPADSRAEFVPVDPAPAAKPGATYAPPPPARHPQRSHSGMKVVALVAGGLLLVAVVGVMLVMRGVRQMARVEQAASPHRPDELVDYREDAPAQAPPPATAPAAPSTDAPATAAEAEVGWDEPPQLANPAEVQRTLVREYPPLQRDAGIGGTASVRFRVRADGSVDIGSMDVQSATNDDFARAALSVVPRMRFRPGRRGGQPAAGWVTLPVSWQTAR